jgi:malonyl CoA-acyl carrier protein transacylase
MADAGRQFGEYLQTVEFAEPRIPVIANVTAAPYESGSIRKHLTDQITSSVRWQESIEYILDHVPEPEFQELGPGSVLTKMIGQIRDVVNYELLLKAAARII